MRGTPRERGPRALRKRSQQRKVASTTANFTSFSTLLYQGGFRLRRTVTKGNTRPYQSLVGTRTLARRAILIGMGATIRELLRLQSATLRRSGFTLRYKQHLTFRPNRLHQVVTVSRVRHLIGEGVLRQVRRFALANGRPPFIVPSVHDRSSKQIGRPTTMFLYTSSAKRNEKPRAIASRPLLGNVRFPTRLAKLLRYHRTLRSRHRRIQLLCQPRVTPNTGVNNNRALPPCRRNGRPPTSRNSTLVHQTVSY